MITPLFIRGSIFMTFDKRSEIIFNNAPRIGISDTQLAKENAGICYTAIRVYRILHPDVTQIENETIH